MTENVTSQDKPAEGPKKQGFLERAIEGGLWNSRFIVLLAVVFGIVSAITMFVAGSFDVIHGISSAVGGNFSEEGNKKLVMHVVGALDIYLIGVVLLIFSFGLYELFISHIDVGRADGEVQILEIESLDDLKNRIIKVVIMVLVVSFFKKVLSMDDAFKTAEHMMYLAISIFAISFGVYFMHKSG